MTSDLYKEWTAALAIALVVSSSTAMAQQTFRDYTVEEGETCTSIAKKIYGDAEAYHHIHEHNDLSDEGYACRAGTTLTLPVLSEKAKAELRNRDGDVRARPPEDKWNSIGVGAKLYESWRVNTLERSRAQLGFQDNSELQMTEHTLVVIYGASKDEARRSVSRRATVEKGRLKTRLADLAGGSVQVETPQSKATFKSGRGQVTVEDEESRVANHEGEPVSVTTPDGSGEVAVDAGQGTRVPSGQPPKPPRELPDTPTWTRESESVALTLQGAQAPVGATWTAVDSAQAYMVEVTRGRQQVDVLLSKRVSGDVTSLEMRGLPAGDYVASVVAIDGDSFESIPSDLRELKVREIGARGDHIVDAEAGRVMIGAALEAPRGMTCRLASQQEAVRRLRIANPGEHTLRCRGDGRGASLDLNAIPPTVESDLDHEVLELERGRRQRIEFAFEPALPPDVTVRSGEGLEARGLQVSPDTMQVNVSVANGAEAGTREASLNYGDITLGSIDIRVPAREREAQPGGQPSGPEHYLTALGGYDAVGLSPYWGTNVSPAGATLEAGMGTMPLPHFAAEARLGLSLHAGERTTSIASVRLQAMAGALETVLAPYAGGGMGWQADLGRARRFAPRLAVGVMPTVSEALRLRGEAAVGVTPEGDRLRWLPEVRLGITWRF